MAVIGAATAGVAAIPVSSAAASTCTDSVTWDGSMQSHVTEDTCGTDIRMVANCAASGIIGNTVSVAGDAFGIGEQDYENWAEACENGGTPPYVYIFFEERGNWTQVAGPSPYGTGPMKTYTQTWTAR